MQITGMLYSAKLLQFAGLPTDLRTALEGKAEIDDHMNRGRDIDTRTPATQCKFVA